MAPRLRCSPKARVTFAPSAASRNQACNAVLWAFEAKMPPDAGARKGQRGGQGGLARQA